MLESKFQKIKFLSSITQQVPAIRGVGRVLHKLAKHYRRTWAEGRIWLDIDGLWMNLDPSEAVDNALIFTLRWVDPLETKALREILRPGDQFVDVGANVGWYSLNASRLVGSIGSVIAFEANPDMAQVIEDQLRINNIKNVTVHNIGVSDKVQELELWIHTSGNLGRSSFLTPTDSSFKRSINVTCAPLSDLITSPVRMMKMDIEGFEFPVLRHFLQNSPSLPDFILIEQWEYPAQSPDNAIDLLLQSGYKLRDRWSHNFLLENSAST